MRPVTRPAKRPATLDTMLQARGGMVPAYVPILGVSTVPAPAPVPAPVPVPVPVPAPAPTTGSPPADCRALHTSTQVHTETDDDDADSRQRPTRHKARSCLGSSVRVARTKVAPNPRRESLESGELVCDSGELVCNSGELASRGNSQGDSQGGSQDTSRNEHRFTVLNASGEHVHIVIDTLEKANAVMGQVVVLPAGGVYLPLSPLCYVYGYIKRYVPFVHDVTMCLAAAFMRRVLLKFAPTSRWLDGGCFKSSVPNVPIERTWMAYYVVCIGLAHKTHGEWRHRFLSRHVVRCLVRCALTEGELFDMELTVLETLDYRMTTTGTNMPQQCTP
jgi:hypothetical protein